MSTLRALRECDVTQIKGWPPYLGDMEQMDYALREKGGWRNAGRGRMSSFMLWKMVMI